jgi:hypothetical protein
MSRTRTRMHCTIILIPILLLTSLLSSLLWSQQSQSTTQAPKESAVPTLPADVPSTADRYSFIMMGNLAGQQAVRTVSRSGRSSPATTTSNRQSTNIIHLKQAPHAGRTTTSKAKRKSQPPPITPLSTADPPRLLSSPTPLSKTAARSHYFLKAKLASSA